MSLNSFHRRIDRLEKRSASPLKVAGAIQAILNGDHPVCSSKVAQLAERFIRETSRVIESEDRAALDSLKPRIQEIT